MPRILKLMTIAGLFAVLNMSGFSQRHRLGFFINVAGYFPSQENINSGYGSGLGAVLYFSPNISVAFEWKHGRCKVNKVEGEFLNGTLYMSPLLASVHYNISTSTPISPYVFIGGGLFFSNFGLGERETPEDENVRKQDIKNGLGFYGGIGSTIKINESLSLFIEGLYLRRKANLETLYIDSSPADSFKANLSFLSVLIGIDYFY